MYGLAVHEPQRFGHFLDRVIADWMGALEDVFADEAERTLYIAAVRELLLDLLTIGEDERVHRAFERLLDGLIRT